MRAAYRKGVKLTDTGERRKENGELGGRGGRARAPLSRCGRARGGRGRGVWEQPELSAEGKSAGRERETRARAGEEASVGEEAEGERRGGGGGGDGGDRGGSRDGGSAQWGG